jgi:hypothetical protein
MLYAIGIGGIPRRRSRRKGFPLVRQALERRYFTNRENATPSLAEFGGVDTLHFTSHAAAGWL